MTPSLAAGHGNPSQIIILILLLIIIIIAKVVDLLHEEGMLYAEVTLTLTLTLTLTCYTRRACCTQRYFS
jgi:hypothetical protein